ncbi:MAG: hypothetical protein JJU35_14440 [Balneolales bacterium]|nr:hypothetical protein [Balneolales bacterium]
MSDTSPVTQFFLLIALTAALCLAGCRSSGSTTADPATGPDEELLQSRTFEVTSERPQAAEPPPGEEVRLSTRFVQEAYADYARRTNAKLTFFFQAQQRYHEGRYSEALTLINRALDISESADALAMKGLIFAGLRAEAQAIEYWQRAVALDPDVFERILLPRERR